MGDYLYAFYSDKEGVRYKRLDPNTLEETADKLLCASSGKKTFQEIVIQSGDKSKIALIIKSSTENKKEVDNKIVVFDSKLSRLWEQSILTAMDKNKGTILQYQIADNGSTYIYYKVSFSSDIVVFYLIFSMPKVNIFS